MNPCDFQSQCDRGKKHVEKAALGTHVGIVPGQSGVWGLMG